MRTTVKKPKLGSNKPASQLFLFSNRFNENIASYFSSSVIVEIDLNSYDFKHHNEANKVVDFMYAYCESSSIEPYKFMTAIHNYKPSGLTLATLSGDYHYPIAVHGSEGYDQLATIHLAHETLKRRFNAFEIYKNVSLSYARIATNEPIKLSERSFLSLKNQLEKSEQSILKAQSDVLATFHKKFQPSYGK